MSLSANVSEKAALIWAIADKLTGVYKPHEYGEVILPLTVIRRFDCILADTKDAVLEKYEAVKNLPMRDVLLRNASGKAFYNTSKFTFERLLQSTGRTVHTMITQSIGAIINIILDPILIHGWFGLPAMGIAGAAIATVIGQWVSGIMVIIFNLKFNPEVQLHKKYLPLEGKTVAAILTVGIPSIVMNSIGSVMNFGINQILQGFAETATGVFGVYFKLQSFFFMPLFGLNNATISIIAYNYGARKPQRITKTLKISCTAALCIMTAGLLVFQFFPDLLLGLFNPSQAFLEIGRVALRTISWSFPIAAICIALGASFQALGNGIYSTIVSLCRQLVVLLPVAYLLSLTGEVQRVWLAFPIAEIVSGTVTFICFTRIYRQKIKPLFEQA